MPDVSGVRVQCLDAGPFYAPPGVTAVCLELRLPSQHAASGCGEDIVIGRSSALVSVVSMAVFFAVAAVNAREFQAGDGVVVQPSSEGQRDNRSVVPMDSAENGRDPRAEVGPARAPLPCRLIASDDLQPFLQRAWDGSATFREQCRKLAAGAVVVLHSSSARDFWRAAAQIGVSPEGVIVARVRVRCGPRTVELIAHELEHVLERMDGVDGAKYLVQSRLGRSVRLLPGGAFETRRAIDAGERVAQEVEQATRARGR
jgi:hypothetical protein